MQVHYISVLSLKLHKLSNVRLEECLVIYASIKLTFP